MAMARPRLWGLIAGAITGAMASLAAATQLPNANPVEGLRDNTPGFIALTHARLVVKPGSVIEDGTLVVRDGIIVSANAGNAIPAGALAIDLGGKTVFAGFIDADSDYAQTADTPAASATQEAAAPYTPQPQQGARHWSSKVRPERDLSQLLKPDAKKAEVLRKLGFTSVLSVPDKGVFRGQSALLTLADSSRLNEVLLKPRVAQHIGFEFSGFRVAEYPTSLMGAIALVRQTWYDARWQRDYSAWAAKQKQPLRNEANLALDALKDGLSAQQPVVFSTEDELDYARALAIGEEFGLKLVLRGNGREYRELARLKAAAVPLIVPLNFTEAPAVEDPEKALDLPLSELEQWEWAPFNARRLAESGIPFAFTAAGLKKPEEQFWANLRKAVSSGLDEQYALAALTVQPASMLGLGARLGTLEAGKAAQLVVADADLFRSDKARIYESWIDGQRYVLLDSSAPDPRGSWTLSWSGIEGPASIELSGEIGDLSAKAGDQTFPAVYGERRLTLYPPGKLLGQRGERFPVSLLLDGQGGQGRGLVEGEREFRVDVRLATPKPRALAKEAARPALPAGETRFPAGEFGRVSPAKMQNVILRHATVWTQSAQGRLDDADVAIADGRIVAIGQGLKAPANALEIDARGKHVAPGIIDTHSHMAIAKGVNEGTHAVTSEVRVGDVLDPTDMTVYRQLAGGVTAAQLLHGSANPIGGQAQVIKLRWGADAEGLRFAAAPPSIKFALGENVKQSNWGPQFNQRYPQTRMGVEQIDLDSLLAAQAYAQAQAKPDKNAAPLRRDLRLEALAEVVQGKRIVHIHSYRQDEILAFARIAQRFKIVPVFQHILEGYKVADVLAKLGAGASGFTDWWAYKMEVKDAIPYNAAILQSQGVVASFNSDSDELGRRLNTEAAKAIKYGGMSETDAFNLVTLNPAKQLRVADKVGSLEPGKDADFAVWSGSPLSAFSRVEQTWIEGRKYFDRNDDIAERSRIAAERERLVAKILPERIKALAKKNKKDGDKKDDAPAAPGEFLGLADDEVHYANLRGPYHDSEPVNTCSAQEAH
ncbi:imidazolonepropionase-like amidohydrolase [Tahibacter aquaticus]|uniref:Imidazolonepropionase-like amidohydrolase n=2 Tax=Tahibacter aquaticus TaxID=520092 RepID=A0A4V3DMT7_9GAMM|nr:imidazolonepropionase-like amidohydrolase [Tahibacter aquaticus]